MKTLANEPTPFVFGAQYYRAPTPEPDCWDHDLGRMAEMGFNAVKYWVQWRWSHRADDRFIYDDLDRLMDLAQMYGLGVTLNVIFDVAPHWLYERYPDAKQVMNNGRVVEPYTVAHRQIGGHPGPCYTHPGARKARREFVATTVKHFRGHPALAMWDVWNEPELSFPQRRPDVQTLVCYCPHCREAFLAWLRDKYSSLDHLNAVWGRCYDDWAQVELPRNPHTITDFVDWREFQIDTLTGEATWRLDVVRTLDPHHVRYLHVVPNTMAPFNAVTCATDDFALAEGCQVFAATMNSGLPDGSPVFPTQVISAARGKRVYNVESHINGGCTSIHQRILSKHDVLMDLLPQIGLGVRGFLFWQYRPEVLGYEAPGWGLVALDGADRPVTRAVRDFWSRLVPHTEAILACPPAHAKVGIWKSRKNDVFHFGIHGTFQPLIQAVEGYMHALYWQSVPYRVVSGTMLAQGDLDGLKVLVMPSPYYVTEEEATALRAWVEAGGVLLSEAHLAGYNGTTGRHSRIVPGCGLAEAWGVREIDSTSSHHLSLAQGGDFDEAMTEDVRKALAKSGVGGGQYFPFRLTDGTLIWGASRYAVLDGGNWKTEAESWTPDAGPRRTEAGNRQPEIKPLSPLIVSKNAGDGAVFYCGTNVGQGSRVDGDGLVALLRRVLKRAGVKPALGMTGGAGHVHVDVMAEKGEPKFLVVVNRGESAQKVALDLQGEVRGLYTGAVWTVDGALSTPGHFVDLFVVNGRKASQS
jgi:beta-galactosidase